MSRRDDATRAFDGLDPLLQEIMQAAHAAWPGVEVAPDVFAAHLATVRPMAVPPELALRQMHTSDLYLACACKAGDPRGLDAFEARCLIVVDSALLKLGFGESVVADVKQELRCRLMIAGSRPPQILGFSGRGSLRSWVRVMAVHAALSMVRKTRNEAALDENTVLQTLVAPGDPELDHLKRVYRGEFKQAFDTALRALPTRERMILRQHFVNGLTIDQLGQLYHVHRATAARSLDRARKALLDATRAQLGEQLQVNPAELDSILRMIRSRLEVSLGVLMRRRKRET